MKRTLAVAASFLFALPVGPLAAAGADAQTAASQAPASPEVPTFAVGANAVNLDVVVRDKKGKAVRDLTAADFEVFEDGVKQSIDAFQVFGRPLEEAPEPPKGAAPAAAAAAPATGVASPQSETRPQVIAFVFDRLSPEARQLAHKASLAYVDKGHVEGDLVAVFAIDLALQPIQPFTRDLTLIRAGLERAASQANTEFANNRAANRNLAETIINAERVADATASAAPTGPGAGNAGANIGASASSAAIANATSSITLSMQRSFESLERDQQGYATSNSLLAVVSGLKSLPGRKTVVFFSEGMVIPANVQAQFRSVIATANRANVSVYTMDAAGLRAESMEAEKREEVRQAAMRRLRQNESGRDDATGGPMTGNLERNEDLLRLNPEAGLGQLANETGGFMIRDTNDAASAFRKMEEDMRFYYLLAYSPTNDNYDGKFRTISVKVKRSGVQVQSRQGYVAIRPSEVALVKTFEAPALAQLDRSTRPTAFPIQALGLSFPTPQRPGLVPVLVHVPANTIAYAPDKEDKSGKKMQRADFTVVVRVKNEAQHEVDRLSQHYLLSVPEANLAAARGGDLLFYREADLPAGRYTLEAVGYDAVAQKASVQTATLEVPRVDGGQVRMSSVILVGRAEKVKAGEQQGDNPLFYGETLLYPNMGEPFRKATSQALGFYFTVYGGKDPAAPRKATIEVLKGDVPAGRVTADLPAPDAKGRIQYAGALPLQSFPPGAYKLKVTATDGSGVDSRQTAFTLAE
jgi:VWFA-related protein